MKKLLMFLMVGILATTCVSAGHTINLLDEQVYTMYSGLEQGVISSEEINALNENLYVQAMIEGYDAVGIKVENSYYRVEIKDDKIVSIQKVYKLEDVDYTIETNLQEVLHVYSNYQKMSKVDILRFMVMDKHVPIKVVFNLAHVLMR